MAAPKKSRFDLSLIGEADKHNLSATFLDAVKRFYEDHANRERFEQWQAQRQARTVAIKS